jgi:hypothetical protein
MTIINRKEIPDLEAEARARPQRRGAAAVWCHNLDGPPKVPHSGHPAVYP